MRGYGVVEPGASGRCTGRGSSTFFSTTTGGCSGVFSSSRRPFISPLNTRADWPMERAMSGSRFAPKSAKAPEGSGYLMGVASYAAENGRADLVILDAEHIEDGPVATVKLPTRIAGQIHGWWVPGSAIPKKA